MSTVLFPFDDDNNVTMRSYIMARGRIAFLAALVLTGCGQHRSGKPTANDSREFDDYTTPEQLYYRHTDSTKNAWNDTTVYFHYWKEMEQGDYLFDSFPMDSVSLWESLCEELNKDIGIEHVPSRYINMNQYVTIYDLIDVWSHRGYDKEHDDFTLWRIEQFRSDTLSPLSFHEKINLLKSIANSICDFEPFFKFEYDNLSCLDEQFQSFYDRLLLRETLKQSEQYVEQALLREDSAWRSYHAAMDEAYQRIQEDPDHLMGSAWGQAILGARQDDAFIREYSLVDLCFSSEENYKPETHLIISDGMVLQEYRRFLKSFAENEYHHPVKVRRKALEKEMVEWQKWMKCRSAVSSLLSGRNKELYDNSTNNARRMKYIMLKNRYQGYGLISNDVHELLVPYSVSDDDLYGPSFDERWMELYGDSL